MTWKAVLDTSAIRAGDARIVGRPTTGRISLQEL